MAYRRDYPGPARHPGGSAPGGNRKRDLPGPVRPLKPPMPGNSRTFAALAKRVMGQVKPAKKV